MANRFWVSGGTGVYSSTTNWSSTSGGTSGASAPTATDDVFVDGLSGTSPAIAVSGGTVSCGKLDFTGSISATVTLTSILQVFDNLTLAPSTIINGTNSLSLRAAGASSRTITTNGATISVNVLISDNGNGGSWTLQDNFVSSKILSHSQGTFITNNKNVNCSDFQCTNSNVRTLTLGSSTITCTGSFDFTNITGLTFTANTASIIMLGSSVSFNGSGLTYGSVTFSGSTTIVNGSNTFTNFTITAGKTVRLTSGTTQTITNLVSNGIAGNLAVINALTAGSAATISTPSTLSVSYLSVKDITLTGTGSLTVTNGTNVSGNTGITFVFTGYSHKIMGQLITKIDGITPTKVNGV